jgi:hypothetical protein
MSEGKGKGAGTEGTAPLTPEQEIEKLRADLATAKADSAKKDQAIEASKKIIAEQAEALADKEVQLASKHPVVKVGKENFQFLGKGAIIIEGVSYSAKEVMENEAHLKNLVELKSGLMKPITVKKGGN